ncbi:hypothetical protein BD779DRAFT_794024 [Infundibulicybe gibba]|nr:hypothetical protein BD779DRAFT_794024 [Infundibulicybe gibba]
MGNCPLLAFSTVFKTLRASAVCSCRASRLDSSSGERRMQTSPLRTGVFRYSGPEGRCTAERDCRRDMPFETRALWGIIVRGETKARHGGR